MCCREEVGLYHERLLQGLEFDFHSNATHSQAGEPDEVQEEGAAAEGGGSCQWIFSRQEVSTL